MTAEYVEMTVCDPPDNRPIFTLTRDRKVIVEGDIYDSAREFWDLVQKMAPLGWNLERREPRPGGP